MDAQITRRFALHELLERPDPPDLHRGSILRLEGKPNRHEQLPYLAMAFAHAKLQEIRARLTHQQK